MSDPTVRLAVVDDAAAIARAHVDAWRVAYDGIVASSYLDDLDVAERTDLWASILRGEVDVPGVERPTDYVVEVEGEVVGFADVGEYRDDNRPEHGELWAMYVHPDHWGSGSGAALMAATLAQFRHDGREVGRLWVLEDNVRARSFYESFGWRVDLTAGSKTIDLGGDQIVEVCYRSDL